MPHAVLVDDFIPSKEEAQSFEDEWRKVGEIDYQNYQKFKLFSQQGISLFHLLKQNVNY